MQNTEHTTLPFDRRYREIDHVFGLLLQVFTCRSLAIGCQMRFEGGVTASIHAFVLLLKRCSVTATVCLALFSALWLHVFRQTIVLGELPVSVSFCVGL